MIKSDRTCFAFGGVAAAIFPQYVSISFSLCTCDLACDDRTRVHANLYRYVCQHFTTDRLLLLFCSLQQLWFFARFSLLYVSILCSSRICSVRLAMDLMLCACRLRDNDENYGFFILFLSLFSCLCFSLPLF